MCMSCANFYHMEIYGFLRGLCVLICHPELSENGGHSWVKKMYTNTLFATKSFQIDVLLGMERVLLVVEFSSIGIESIKADPMTEIFFGSRKLHETYMAMIF